MSKVVMFSNYINHHQLPFCKEMVSLTNNNFNFVSQKAISEKRIAFGYKNISNDYDFVVKTYENSDELNRAYKLADEADYVIFGSSNTDYLKNRLKNNKITFKYSERLFRNKMNVLDYIRAFRRVYINHGKYRNKKLYSLCSGAYAAYDFNRFGAYKNKTYKWGYFPETINYDIDELFKIKINKKIVIIWCGRLMQLKHPDMMIDLANRLLKEKYQFEIRIAGNGELENELKKRIENENLSKNIKMLGSMSPSEVRKEMEKANIFVFTSDKREGWGAVLNEAMNSGCACVSSHAIGSTCSLIKHNENGLIYKDGDFEDFYNKVKYLVDNKKERNEIGKKAYETISNLWNAKVAAERFLILAKNLEEGKDTPFIDGPCSKAYPIKDEDMYEYLMNKNENS